MILKMLAVGPFAPNCYIVGSEETREGIIIDPGDEPETILKAVEEEGLKIKLLVVTHTHIDHVGAVRQVKEATGAEYAMHEAEAKSEQGYGRVMASYFGVAFDPPPPPDKLLQGGDSIKVGDFSLTVLHTPGHSPGGISLLGPEVVFTGDTLFNFSVGRTDFPGCSHAQLMDSIITKLMVLPDRTVVYPGHGPKSTIGAERRFNPFLQE